MRISIDIDGVLANFAAGLIRTANRRFRDRLSSDYEPTDWGYGGVFNPEEWKQVWTDIKQTQDFWEHLPAYEQNLCVLKKFLYDCSEHDIYFVTSRIATEGSTVLKQTLKWLECRLGRCSVIVVPEAGRKKDVFKALGIDVSVDDYGPTVEECSKLEGHRAYILDRPWNRDKDYGKRVFNLEQFLNIAVKAKEEDYFLV